MKLIVVVCAIALVLSSCSDIKSEASDFLHSNEAKDLLDTVDSGIDEWWDETSIPDWLDDLHANKPAYTYMTDSFGEIFTGKENIRQGGGRGSQGESYEIEYFIQFIDYPYDYVKLTKFHSYIDDSDKFKTDYPHVMFANEAGAEWEKMLRSVFPKMEYMAYEWVYTTEEEAQKYLAHAKEKYEFKFEDDYNRFVPNYKGTGLVELSGFTKDSSLQEYIEESRIYGILMLPRSLAPMNKSGFDMFYENSLSDSSLHEPGYLYNLSLIDVKYDIDLVVMFIEDDYFDELSGTKNPVAEVINDNCTFQEDKLLWLTSAEYAARNIRDFRFLYQDDIGDIVKLIGYSRNKGEVTIFER